MKIQFKLPLLTLISAAIVGATPAYAAGLTGNVGASNNYIWRGVTQTNDQAAVTGGLDYDFGNGLSLGGWASNVDFLGISSGYELDIYGAYGGKAGSVDYSLGFIHYLYPVHDNIDFTEVTAGLGFGSVSLDIASTVAADNEILEGDLYVALSGELEVKPGLSLGALVGNYDFDAGGDYTHYQASLSKGDFTFAIDANDLPSASRLDDPRVSISWNHDINL